MRKEIVTFLADSKKSLTGNMYEDEWEIMIPMGMFEELPNGKTIKMIKQSEINNYEPLGQATGLNIQHTLILGEKYCENFFIRLSGYAYVMNSHAEKIIHEETDKQYLTVAFFENKK